MTNPTQSPTDAELVRLDELTKRWNDECDALSVFEVQELTNLALALLEPLRASRREYGEKAWLRGWRSAICFESWEPMDGNKRMRADLDALEREGK